jgi:drug/metabolite transporter (DMT)-like permease
VSRYRSVALFLGLAALWGGSFPAIEVGLETFPPVFFAAARYDIAGLLLLGYAVVATSNWRPRTRADLWVVLASGTFMIAGNSLLFLGQQSTTAGVASIIYSLIPILTTVAAWGLLPEERFTSVGLVGLAVGFAGVAAIARPDPDNLLAAGVVGKGLVALAALSVAVGSVLVRRSESTLPRAPFTAWSMLVGAVLLHAGSLLTGESPLAGPTPPLALGVLAYLAVLATAVAFLIYFWLLANFGPLETNLVSYVVPVVATATGWLLLDEPVSAWTVGGFCLILAGFLLLKRSALRAEIRRFRSERPAD